MTKLTDTQAILLSTASLRDDHSLYALPELITAGATVAKAIKVTPTPPPSHPRVTKGGRTRPRETQRQALTLLRRYGSSKPSVA